MEGMVLLGSSLAKLPKILAKIVILSLFLSDWGLLLSNVNCENFAAADWL